MASGSAGHWYVEFGDKHTQAGNPLSVLLIMDTVRKWETIGPKSCMIFVYLWETEQPIKLKVVYILTFMLYLSCTDISVA